MTTSYCTLPDLKTWLQISDTRDDTLLQQVIDSVSRWIDGYCGRSFGLDTPTARTFQAEDFYCVDVDDIGTQTGLIVKVDADGDGTFETTWAASDYQLQPVNAPSNGPEPAPWREIRAVGSRTFPLVWGYGGQRLDRVQITAGWGWPAVPDTVAQACIMQTSRVFKRRDSPQGVLGGGDFGVVRVTSRLDPDVEQMLDEYRLATTIVNLA